MKQYRSVVVFLVAAIGGAVIAYPGPAQPEPIADLNDAVAEAIHRETAEYLTIIYDTVQAPKVDEQFAAIEEFIAASLPESLRQDVADELSDEVSDGILSDDLKERIRQHILDWLLQYLPKDLRVDITSVLEEYRTTGQVIRINEELVDRIRRYVASLETDYGRNKRGFWGDLSKHVAEFCAEYLVVTVIASLG